MEIAIIGAGMAGLTCAQQLQARGHRVTIYEKSHAVSGRMSTRQTELGGFDHGAQYFTATTPQFKKVVSTWLKAGIVAPWLGTFVALENGKTAPAGQRSRPTKQRYVGVPGMRSLGVHLSNTCAVRAAQRVERIESYGKQWVLMVASETAPIAASAGPFDAVLLAIPADQAVPLLSVVPDFAERAKQALMAPCWTLLMAFQDSLQLGYDGAWVTGSRLGWLAHDASKPGRRPGEHWIANASVPWSIEHLEDDPERVKEKLLKAFHEATGSHVQPVYAAVHRWRYAQALQPLDASCLWQEKQRIGVCGDWFAAGLTGAGRIENAFLSGTALASMVA